MSASTRRRVGASAIALSVVFALIAAGCASEPPPAASGTTAANGSAAALPGAPGCFWLRNFDGSWTVLNERQLLVYAPLNGAPYLVQLFEPVPTLRFAQRLGFEDVEHSGQICNNATDFAIIPNWAPRRVPIIAVRQVTPQEARALMLANGLKVPKQKAGT